MSNNCENTLRITGPVAAVLAFQEFAQGNESLDIDRFLPIPEGIRKTGFPNASSEEAQRFIDIYGQPNWLMWTTANWGTKWGVYQVEKEIIDDVTIEYQYLSHITPLNEKALLAMSDRYPKLRLEERYTEPLMGSTGHRVLEAGMLLKSSVCETEKEGMMMTTEEITAGNLSVHGPRCLGIEFPAQNGDYPMPEPPTGFRWATEFGYTALVVDGTEFVPLAHLCGALAEITGF